MLMHITRSVNTHLFFFTIIRIKCLFFIVLNLIKYITIIIDYLTFFLIFSVRPKIWSGAKNNVV